MSVIFELAIPKSYQLRNFRKIWEISIFAYIGLRGGGKYPHPVGVKNFFFRKIFLHLIFLQQIGYVHKFSEKSNNFDFLPQKGAIYPYFNPKKPPGSHPKVFLE